MFKVGDEVFYIDSNRLNDKLVIASVQKGVIEDIWLSEVYYIKRSLHDPEDCFQTEEEANNLLILVMDRKIAYLKGKIYEFMEYKKKLLRIGKKEVIEHGGLSYTSG